MEEIQAISGLQSTPRLPHSAHRASVYLLESYFSHVNYRLESFVLLLRFLLKFPIVVLRLGHVVLVLVQAWPVPSTNDILQHGSRETALKVGNRFPNLGVLP